jgi:hypothetical protein
MNILCYYMFFLIALTLLSLKNDICNVTGFLCHTVFEKITECLISQPNLKPSMVSYSLVRV